jgi:hypothetical protein
MMVSVFLIGGGGGRRSGHCCSVRVVESFSPISTTQSRRPKGSIRNNGSSRNNNNNNDRSRRERRISLINHTRIGHHRRRDLIVVESSATTEAEPVTSSEIGFDVIVDEEQNVDERSNGDTFDVSNRNPFMIELQNLDTMEVKRRLLDLLPRMMGTQDEFRQVEAYVNTLEERYQSIQTLDFLNLALNGEWQLLFSTNLSGGPKPFFRLRELCQNINTDNLKGSIVNVATWDLANNFDGDGDPDGSSAPVIFDSSGTFSVNCSYNITQGARMVVALNDHVLQLAKGSSVPKDVEKLVGLLHRTIPKELFDPNDHAMDTTYLDADVRIVRMTGPRLEGVRDIFIRSGSMEITPFK